MIGKILKYLKSFGRILIIKLVFGKRIKFKYKSLKSLYIGKNVKIKIEKNKMLYLGEGVYISDNCLLECLKGDIIIGRNTFFNRNCNIVSLKGISIGEDCLFGPNVCIYDHDHSYDIVDVPITKQGCSSKEIDINDNVWVGSNCTITKGVKIQKKIIVAANSVVAKDLNKSGIYAGVPSKLIKNI